MVVKILVPSLGESISEATVGSWLKKVGDFVNSDETLLEIETDKVAIEVPSPASGILSEISITEGQMVEPGGFLGYIQESSSGDTDFSKNPVQLSQDLSEKSIISYQMPQSPSAAKIMAENAVELSDVKGTGKRGQILKSDVVSALSTQVISSISCKDSIESKATSGEERIKMSRLRQIIAKRLKDAQNTAAILTTYNEVDMSRILAIRSRYKDLFEKKYAVKLGFMGFFIKAVCQALQEIRGINAEIDGDNIVYKNYCNIGVAVGTEKGLVVPVLRHADQMSLAEIEKSISRLAKLAREGKLSVDDLRNGTFTISNGGVYGSLLSSPILNPPQSGILGMHKIQERAVVENGQIIARPMMYIALSYDHRIVDGKESVMFLVRVKEYLEDPERFILDI